MIECQKLYDVRERTSFCSGSDLQEFFLNETGEPSPSGKTLIDRTHAKEFFLASWELIFDSSIPA